VSTDKPLATKPGSAAKVLPSVFIKSYGPHVDFPKHGSLGQGKFHAKTVWAVQAIGSCSIARQTGNHSSLNYMVEKITGDADMPSISEQEAHAVFQSVCE